MHGGRRPIRLTWIACRAYSSRFMCHNYHVLMNELCVVSHSKGLKSHGVLATWLEYVHGANLPNTKDNANQPLLMWALQVRVGCLSPQEPRALPVQHQASIANQEHPRVMSVLARTARVPSSQRLRSSKFRNTSPRTSRAKECA